MMLGRKSHVTKQMIPKIWEMLEMRDGGIKKHKRRTSRKFSPTCSQGSRSRAIGLKAVEPPYATEDLEV
jgi:hypothetical protein